MKYFAEAQHLYDDICHSKIYLSQDYDRFKVPEDPMNIRMVFFIRQVSQVHEERMSYDLILNMWIMWQDKRLIGQTERAGCNPMVYNGKRPKIWLPGKLFHKIFTALHQNLIDFRSDFRSFQRSSTPSKVN